MTFFHLREKNWRFINICQNLNINIKHLIGPDNVTWECTYDKNLKSILFFSQEFKKFFMDELKKSEWMQIEKKFTNRDFPWIFWDV